MAAAAEKDELLAEIKSLIAQLEERGDKYPGRIPGKRNSVRDITGARDALLILIKGKATSGPQPSPGKERKNKGTIDTPPSTLDPNERRRAVGKCLWLQRTLAENAPGSTVNRNFSREMLENHFSDSKLATYRSQLEQEVRALGLQRISLGFEKAIIQRRQRLITAGSIEEGDIPTAEDISNLSHNDAIALMEKLEIMEAELITEDTPTTPAARNRIPAAPTTEQPKPETAPRSKPPLSHTGERQMPEQHSSIPSIPEQRARALIRELAPNRELQSRVKKENTKEEWVSLLNDARDELQKKWREGYSFQTETAQKVTGAVKKAQQEHGNQIKAMEKKFSSLKEQLDKQAKKVKAYKALCALIKQRGSQASIDPTLVTKPAAIVEKLVNEYTAQRQAIVKAEKDREAAETKERRTRTYKWIAIAAAVLFLISAVGIGCHDFFESSLAPVVPSTSSSVQQFMEKDPVFNWQQQEQPSQ